MNEWGGNLYRMNSLRSVLYRSLLPAAWLLLSLAGSAAQTSTHSAQAPGGVKQNATGAAKSPPPALVESGSALFRQDCSFCHGRDAGGGESGPDLTRSKVVTADVRGDKIGAVVRNGRPERGMPRFDLSDRQISSLAAFIHTHKNACPTKKGGRKGVDVSDLQTGNVEAGKKYFDGSGRCATCHSPTGDLAGIASRYRGLELEEQMLYPKHPKSGVSVTLAGGQTITGTLEYLDEFTVGLIDATGWYRSWRTDDVQYKVDAPVNTNVELFSKNTDADIK